MEKVLEKTPYTDLSNGKLLEFIQKEVKKLDDSSKVFLKVELSKRRLSKYWIRYIDTENQSFNEQEKKDIFQTIYHLKCEHCHKTSHELRGFQTNQVISLLVLLQHIEEEKILCKRCGLKEKATSMFITLLLGWWSGRGVFLTPYLFFKDLINLFFLKKISTKIIHGFIEENTGILRRKGISKELLKRLIDKFNNQEEGN